MKISSQEEYGLRCILQLARRPHEPLTLAEIAEGEALTSSYVAKLMGQLRAAGVVEAVRGRSGGYILGSSPEEISVNDVLLAFSGQLFEGDFCESHNGLTEACVHMGTSCGIKTLWGVLDTLIDSVLSTTTLADLITFGTSARFHELLRRRSGSGLD